MENRLKKVIITGATGGVGVALINELLLQNINILIFQRKDSKRSNNIPKDNRIKIEYYSLEEIKDYIPQENDYDVFFHLGWTNTQREFRDDIEKQEENIRYSCDAVELAYRMGCHTFIGTGSQAEYGRVEKPLRGDMVCNPETAYGIMKLCACYATRFLCNQHGIRHVWVRILSGYGLYDNPDSMLIANIIKSINHEKLAFSKGEQIWDFTYMDDIADALLAVARYGKDGAIYPIGSGEARPLKEYMRILCDALGEDYTEAIGKVPYSKKQIMYLEADNSEILKDTGWKPEVSFDEGIKKVITFYRELINV